MDLNFLQFSCKNLLKLKNYRILLQELEEFDGIKEFNCINLKELKKLMARIWWIALIRPQSSTSIWESIAQILGEWKRPCERRGACRANVCTGWVRGCSWWGWEARRAAWIGATDVHRGRDPHSRALPPHSLPPAASLPLLLLRMYIDGISWRWHPFYIRYIN